MFKFKELVEANIDELALMLSSEHGKVVADARGDVQRGLEVVEVCMGLPNLLKGEFTDSAGPGIDLYSMRQALGGRRTRRTAAGTWPAAGRWY